MAKYIIASTDGPSGRRPWGSRLQGVGDYQRAQVTIPTQSQANLPTPGEATGGLGFDLSSIPPWALWLGAAAAAYFLLGGSRKHRA
jgi:hypothetical protein